MRGMPTYEFYQEGVCEACQKGKMKRLSHKSKTVTSITNPLQLIHMDLFGPVNIMSLLRKKYALVMVDDFSRYTWVEFLASKDEAPQVIIVHIKKIDKEAKANNASVIALRSDNGTEFRNATLEAFCKENGISQQFTAPRTPQQNGVVERKNRTLIEAARTMLLDAKLPTCFWAEAVNTACYIQNRTLINKNTEKTPYNLMSGKKPTLKHIHAFGSKCFVLKDNSEYVGKFDAKEFEGIFLGYSMERTAFKVYVVGQKKVMESTDVTFDDNRLPGLEEANYEDRDPLKFDNMSDSEDEFETEVEIPTQQTPVNEETREEFVPINSGETSIQDTPVSESTFTRGSK